MECNQETLQFLSQSILQTLYPIPEARRAAERSLLETAEKSNYGLAFLRLVAELSVDEQTSRQAAASINFTDVQSFIENIITPELQSPDVNSDPTLKAGSLKFLTMFRSQLPKPFAMQMFPELVSLLKAESNAVRSYSASCIEKLLLVKDEGGRRRYVGSDISPFLLQLMTNLFDALEIPGSEEDQYVMKCVMRVLGVAEITWEEVAEPCLEGLTPLLREACQKNPKNSVFYHYLFESVAALVRRACERDDLLIVAFDLSLFPILLTILTNDVQELVPYSLQLLAQLVELSAPPISPDYMNIFVLILSVPSPWNTRRDVPGLVRLLQAFLRKSPHELTQGNRLSQALGVFEKLVKSPSTYEQGCQVLCTVLENTEYEYGAIAPYTTSMWSSLFTRLQQKTTPEFLKSLVVVMSLFAAKHGPATLVDTMNAVQPNIFVTILNRFWIPNLTLVTGTLEVKLAAVAATRLVCETPALLVPIVSRLWGTMVNSIVTLFTRPDEETRAVDDDDEPENVGYTADAFVNLCNVGRREVDPLEEISDPKEFLVTSLAALSAAHPGRLPLVIRYNLDKVNQDALILLCAAYNCVIV